MKHATLQVLLAAFAAPIQAAFFWKNVHIGGGGGFIPGIVFHPKTKGLAYARSDLGGLYRLNSDDSWTPVTDNNSFADDANWHRWGIDAVALDPQDPQKVFAAVGMYTNQWDTKNGQIARSYDQGATWRFTDLPFKVGGNMPGRGTGERLAFDPKNNNILYFGARSGNGLWKSTDGGASFSKVTSFTAVGNYRQGPQSNLYSGDIQGLTFITFDETSARLNDATSRIFVGTADSTGPSVYVSNDAGATWSAVSGQPGQPGHFFPHKAKIQPTEKALYVSYSNGTGPYDGGDGAVWRYDLTANSWRNISPVNGSDLYFGYGGLTVDLQKPGTLVVTALNSWWPDGQIFRSTDSGATWKKLWHWGNYPERILNYTQSTPKAPWIQKGFLDVDTKDLGWMMESVEIDPFDSNHWLYGTGLTVYGGHDLTNWDKGVNVTIQALADGIEETSVQAITSVPGGSELLVAVYDENGFTFKSQSDLNTPPQNLWSNPIWSSSTGVDYAGNKPSSIVRVGNVEGKQMLATSNDGGFTWAVSSAADTTHYGGTVAYSADASTILWSTATLGVVRTVNNGKLAGVGTLPPSALIASDKKNSTVFYGSSVNQPRFYRSTDGGATFNSALPFLNATEIRHVLAHPAKGGDVWVSTNIGIFHSTNFGASFAHLSTTVTNTSQLAIGLGDGSAYNLYAAGNGPQGRRIYGSPDLGVTWTDVQGTQSFGALDSLRLAGSGNVANLLHVGTNGRGAFYASAGLTKAAAAPTSTKPGTAATAPTGATSAAASAPQQSTGGVATKPAGASTPKGEGITPAGAQPTTPAGVVPISPTTPNLDEATPTPESNPAAEEVSAPEETPAPEATPARLRWRP